MKAAIKTADGRMFVDDNHGFAYGQACNAGVHENAVVEEGFVNDEGEFFSREEAFAQFGQTAL